VSAVDSDWKHYRFRVYETVIPLRNTIWGQIPMKDTMKDICQLLSRSRRALLAACPRSAA
jgi:hypothetical protein